MEFRCEVTKITENELRRIFYPTTLPVCKFIGYDNSSTKEVCTDGSLCVKEFTEFLKDSESIHEALFKYMEASNITEIKDIRIVGVINVDKKYIKPRFDITLDRVMNAGNDKIVNFSKKLSLITPTSFTNKCQTMTIGNAMKLLKAKNITITNLYMNGTYRVRLTDEELSLKPFYIRQKLINEFDEFMRWNDNPNKEDRYWESNMFAVLRVFNKNGDAINNGARDIKIAKIGIGYDDIKVQEIVKELKEHRIGLIGVAKGYNKNARHEELFKTYLFVPITLTEFNTNIPYTNIDSDYYIPEKAFLHYFGEDFKITDTYAEYSMQSDTSTLFITIAPTKVVVDEAIIDNPCSVIPDYEEEDLSDIIYATKDDINGLFNGEDLSDTIYATKEDIDGLFNGETGEVSPPDQDTNYATESDIDALFEL